MDFEKLLEGYEEAIELAKTQKQRKNAPKGAEYWNAFIDGAFHLFQNIKREIDFKPQVDDPTEEEKQKYYLKEYKEYPVGILRYRGQEVPIYIDDYGQQEFIVIDGKTYGGGTYNTLCEYDFCMIIDRIINEQIANIKAER